MQLELRTNNDHGTTGVVNTLAQKVLAKAALLAFERPAQRLQRPVVYAAKHTTTTPVVEQSIDCFLQHALFIADDDFGSTQLHQLLQAVIAVDNSAIEIVQVGSSEAAAIERHQRTQLRWNDRDHVQDHPLGTIARLQEAGRHLEAL